MKRWLEERVRKDLLDWGFNTVGWVQEVVTRNESNHRHSRNFTYEEYQWLDMPYCHMLPFINSHQWEIETKHPDLFSKGFEEWCDYVARDHCVRLVDDQKLIGYFYSDCPTWVHTRPGNEWKGPLFDPEKLKSDSGKKELFRLASHYYKVTHDAVRRYDPNHLLFGDRYEARAPLPEEVVSAALPYVDVLSFQDFGSVDQIESSLSRWANYSKKPVLLADSAGITKGENGALRVVASKYRETMNRLKTIPECIGFHLCGAYLQNKSRNRGLRFIDESPDTEVIEVIQAVNQETNNWLNKQS